MQATKVLTILLNVLTWAVSCVVLGVGIWMMVNPYGVVNEFITQAIPIVFICLGGLTGFAAIYGCFAAQWESPAQLRVFLGTFAFLIMVLVIFLVTGFFYEYSASVTVPAIWNDQYANDPGFLANVERKFRCCGLTTVDDKSVPKPTFPDENLCLTDKVEFGFERPCYPVLTHQFDQELMLTMGSAIVVTGLMILTFVSALVLYSRVVAAQTNPFYETQGLLSTPQ